MNGNADDAETPLIVTDCFLGRDGQSARTDRKIGREICDNVRQARWSDPRESDSHDTKIVRDAANLSRHFSNFCVL